MKQEKGKKLYEALPFLPGITELQFIKGVVDERHKKITSLLDNYNYAVRNMVKSGIPPQAIESTSGRKVTVDQEIFQRLTVIPHNEMKDLINDTDYIAAGICNCRLQGALRDKPCSKPDNNCMIFGTSARSTVERGFTRKLSREEALQMLDEAEKAGLVHQYCNTPDRYINFICNCCICHCSLLKGTNKSPVPSQSVNTRYLIQINDLDCIGCEACIDRCQLNALKMADGKLVREEKRCIGCGLCMYVCPTDALTLEPREAGKTPLKKC